VRQRLAHVWKWGAGTLSAGAALASILSSVHGYNSAARVRWIGLTPAADTAYAIDDTLQLATTMTDAHGERLAGIIPGWRSTDTSVATVDSAGSVIARAMGTATIVVAAGDRIAQSRIVVAPRGAGIRIYGQDSLLRVPEGEERRLVARVVDARGHVVAGERVAWRAQDPAIADVDSAATLRTLAAGRTVLTAAGADHSDELTLEVYPVAGSITLLSGDGQRAPAGQRLPLPVRAQVVSRSGRPMAGVPVHFLGGAGGAVGVDAATDTTDASGVAHVEWKLAGVPGRQRLAVGVDGIAGATFALAEAEPVPANTRVTPLDSGWAGPAGEPLATLVGIRVTDSTGVPLGDLPVTWSTEGAGSVEGDGARTDSVGEARAHWRLGPRAGLQRVFAQVGGPRALPRVALRALARAGDPAAVRSVGTAAPAGTAGMLLRPAPAFVVTDRLGNPVAGVPVQLSVSAGSLRDSVPSSDAAGRVVAVWSLGPTAGNQQLSAAAPGLRETISLTARARSGRADSLAIAGVPPTAAAGTVLGAPVRVQVLDVHGNPVSGASVRVAVTAGKVMPGVFTSDAHGQGLVRWTVGPTSGRQTLTAAVRGGSARAAAVLQVTPAGKAKR
jgi:Big-like domain-containing protein